MRFGEAMNSKKMVTALEMTVILFFCIALYWNLHTLMELKRLGNECKKLENTITKLDRIEKRINNFKRLKSSILSPMADQEARYHWEEVSLQFEPIVFSSLLSRLTLLNSEIQKKYHKRGIFVLTDFTTFRNRESDEGQSQSNSVDIQKDLRPGFKIKGKLLCLSQ